MEITLSEITGMMVLRLKGRLDATSAKGFREEMERLVGEGRIRMVVHMGAIDFIDSSGLGALVGSLRSVNRRGGDIKVAALQAPVRSVFELTRLDRIFEIFDDAAAAAAAFENNGLDGNPQEAVR